MTISSTSLRVAATTLPSGARMALCPCFEWSPGELWPGAWLLLLQKIDQIVFRRAKGAFQYHPYGSTHSQA
jgi:hypothetical protein